METALVPVDPPPPGALLAPGGATAPPAALVYLASLQSEKSRVSMRSCLLRAWRLLDGQGDALLGPWHSLTYADVLALRARLAASGLAPDSCNQTLAAVRGTIKQAWLLGLATHETYERVKQIEPVRGKRIPRGRMLSPVEQAKLLEACDGTTLEGARDGALLAVMLGTGFRREEIARLTAASFEPRAFGGLGSLRTLGKGNKEIEVPLPPGSRAALDAWLVRRGPEPGPLFPRVRSGGVAWHDWLPEPITGVMVHGVIRAAAARAGLRPVTPHDARRTCISGILASTSDLALAQRYVGHASPATTARYDRRGDEALARAARLLAVPFVGWGSSVPHPRALLPHRGEEARCGR